MAEVDSAFVPVSHLTPQGRVEGFIASWTTQCERCDRQCESASTTGTGVCRYGVNYHRISDRLLLFGFILQAPILSQTQQKVLRQNPRSGVRSEVFYRALAIFQENKKSAVQEAEAAKSRLVEEYRESAMYKVELLELLKPEIQKSLAFLHDYRQFVAQVKQNMNVVLQNRFPGEQIDTQLQRVTAEEAAIYWSAALMDDKLSIASLLTQPELLAAAPRTQFRLHGFVLKHIRIYNAAFAKKGIELVQTGFSSGDIIAPQAFATIPHTLLDNALKYSSRGSKVLVNFREDENHIDFDVTSYGPKIEENEKNTIFNLFSRGINGIAQQEEGSGIGLYLAQFVAKNLGTEIRVRQSQQKSRWGYETNFSVRLRRSA